jgi:hypothetical protein
MELKKACSRQPEPLALRIPGVPEPTSSFDGALSLGIGS